MRSKDYISEQCEDYQEDHQSNDSNNDNDKTDKTNNKAIYSSYLGFKIKSCFLTIKPWIPYKRDLCLLLKMGTLAK